MIQLGSRRSVFPDDGRKEMPTGTVNGIKKDLGLK
jgi:hypothetical protein